MLFVMKGVGGMPHKACKKRIEKHRSDTAKISIIAKRMAAESEKGEKIAIRIEIGIIIGFVIFFIYIISK